MGVLTVRRTWCPISTPCSPLTEACMNTPIGSYTQAQTEASKQFDLFMSSFFEDIKKIVKRIVPGKLLYLAI